MQVGPGLDPGDQFLQVGLEAILHDQFGQFAPGKTPSDQFGRVGLEATPAYQFVQLGMGVTFGITYVQ